MILNKKGGLVDMSLFGPSKRELLEWQAFVTGKPSSKLLMNKAQLKTATQQIAQDSLRISNDCVRIISETMYSSQEWTCYIIIHTSYLFVRNI